MKKSYFLILTLAALLVFSYSLDWALPLKLMVIANSMLLLIDCIYRFTKLVRGAK